MSNTEAHTAKCLRPGCGRTRHFATAEAARKAGPYGRVCSVRVRAAALAEAVKGFAQAQVDKARELIADGGLIPVRGQIFRAVSSKGDGTYLASPQTCNCPGGLRRSTATTCYHSLAAKILVAAKAV